MRHRLLLVLGLLGCALNAHPASSAGCLPTGNGYLRARVGGALNLDIDWSNAELECDGSPRPDGSGIRLSFAGPLRSDGRRIRMVFGIGETGEGRTGSRLPTNLTVMFEGEQRLFSTRGAERCTVDELNQERIGALGGDRRTYRVIARGFCVEPASALKGDERIVVSRFDFAGGMTFEDDIADLGTFPRGTLSIQSGKARHAFKIWLAETRAQQSQGLMYVSDLPADRGMLFIQETPRPMAMWMKNTLIPLDMLFIDTQHRIVKIAERTVPESLDTIRWDQPVLAVLEIRGGEAAQRHLQVGDTLSWRSIK